MCHLLLPQQVNFIISPLFNATGGEILASRSAVQYRLIAYQRTLFPGRNSPRGSISKKKVEGGKKRKHLALLHFAPAVGGNGLLMLSPSVQMGGIHNKLSTVCSVLGEIRTNGRSHNSDAPSIFDVRSTMKGPCQQPRLESYLEIYIFVLAFLFPSV